MLASASNITDAFSTGLTAVQTDVMDIIGIALPIALGIVGVFLAVKFGMKFFKRVSN